MSKLKVVFACRAIAVGVVTSLSLLACGGGELSLSGEALTGAPLKQASISVIDSTNRACAQTQTDDSGNWRVSLGSCSPAPYLLSASTLVNGQSVTYFSAATASEVNNASKILVSQLTDAQVKLALRTAIPRGTDAAGLTAEKLKDASVQLMAGLVPTEVLGSTGVDATQDMRTMPVVAGSGQGLDKLHDRLPLVQVVQAGADLQMAATVAAWGMAGADSIVVGATIPVGAPVGTALTSMGTESVVVGNSLEK